VPLAYLALGSNVGDREGQLQRARDELSARGVRILRASPVEETPPWGVAEQAAFLNQILEVDFPGEARALLEIAKAVEQRIGRVERFRWGPREIDVDILLFGDLELTEPDLVIPHPRLLDRPFLVGPLRALRPDLHILG
jgi:2-amino-4-hydroxy-6-hydroxymethyldihydropteridine diphosphokinase